PDVIAAKGANVNAALDTLGSVATGALGQVLDFQTDQSAIEAGVYDPNAEAMAQAELAAAQAQYQQAAADAAAANAPSDEGPSTGLIAGAAAGLAALVGALFFALRK